MKKSGKVGPMAKLATIATIDENKREWLLQTLNIEIRKRNLNPTKVAKLMGAKPSWLYRILRGERAMDLFVFLKMMEVLDVSPSDIFRDYPLSPEPKKQLKSADLAKLLAEIIPGDVLDAIWRLKKPQN